ncbi:4-hydroxy-2-oxo-heptane-1,7-dioate aldolase [Rhodobacteraceae bacterium RKSG542]|uniref:HpcH/HpaI aldolase family protein n=1 Tax=Pseudovibrio flavus TaxID=2529854 RepID=UPI0012BD47E0|nr:aldolase/citrate lyase family protein [Pseudovibrio flavus]MTI18032.1 4-hydroxy-2-oxo-heptane-1,7-dioate aldolase [Pseudovibrio flavus]
MSYKPNTFKQALKDRSSKQLGIWTSLSNSLTAEISAGAGFDWLVVDAEHSPNDVLNVLPQLQAIAAYDVEAVVRVPTLDITFIKRYLDIGARTLLIPFVQNEQEAKDAVAFTRYPGAGVRGVSVGHRANRFGRVKDYLHNASDDICVIIQAETREAIEELPKMVAVDGIDAIFIGPSDLAASFGHLGNPLHPEVQEAIATAVKICKEAGKAIGTLAPVEADARRYFDMGFDFIAVGSDLGLLARSTEALRAKFEDVK